MNKKINVLIIEDEKISADNLEALILGIDKNIRVAAKIGSVKNAVMWLSANHPDLIFMDIQLSDGICFAIFDSIKVKTPIIFTTAYHEYAIRAFKLNSIDYLLKPINKQELQNSIEKFGELYNNNQIVDLEYLKEYFLTQGKKQEYKQRFLITIGNKIKTIEIADISYFFIDEGGVYIKTIDNKSYLIDSTLDKLEFFVDPFQFYRINRKYLIHIKSIKEMIVMSKSRIKLELKQSSAEDVYVSFNKTHDFKKWLNK